MVEVRSDELRDLQTFVVELGAALNAVGEPVCSVQERLTRVSRSYGARSARISAFPTYMMVSMGRGEPATVRHGSARWWGTRSLVAT
ncbi:MAG: threonine/serine exporter family protein [Actinomycetota bacterium]